jgi:hypothetical protein
MAEAGALIEKFGQLCDNVCISFGALKSGPKPKMEPSYFLQDAQGAYYPINGPTLIGRDSTCQIRLSDPEVSRTHALLWVERKILYLRDENTSNGTYLNEWRLPTNQPIAVSLGSQLRFGNSTLTVVALAPASPPGPEAGPAPSLTPQPSNQLPLLLSVLALGLCLSLLAVLVVGFFLLRFWTG